MRDDFDPTTRLPQLLVTSAVSYEPLPTVARGPITPPRLRAVHPGDARTPTRATIASLRLPAGLVQRRAAELAAHARSGGAQHSLRLWRGAHEQALVSLARETTGTPESAPCDALFWEKDGDEFVVSITFGRAAAPLLH